MEKTINHIKLFENKNLPEKYDYLAPDSIKIRLLTGFDCGNTFHCTLSSRKVSTAVQHKTVNRIWYIISEEGKLWQSNGREEGFLLLQAGCSGTIPVVNSFQFSSTGKNELCNLFITISAYPGLGETEKVKGYWT